MEQNRRELFRAFPDMKKRRADLCCTAALVWGLPVITPDGEPLVRLIGDELYAFHDHYGVNSREGNVWYVARKGFPVRVDGEPLPFVNALMRAISYERFRVGFLLPRMTLKEWARRM
jgi:hypothetical protein